MFARSVIPNTVVAADVVPQTHMDAKDEVAEDEVMETSQEAQTRVVFASREAAILRKKGKQEVQPQRLVFGLWHRRVVWLQHVNNRYIGAALARWTLGRSSAGNMPFTVPLFAHAGGSAHVQPR